MPVEFQSDFGWKDLVKLDAGGQAEVWAGTNRETGRREALKVFHGFVMDDDALVQMIHREIRILGKMRHPSIIQLYGACRYAGHFILVMELVDGQSLAKKLAGGLNKDWLIEARRIRFVASALAYAHKLGIIHRDLKLENLMEAPDGTVKVLDFGISTAFDELVLTGKLELKGSPRYMAPEVYLGNKTDFRSDIYSLGVCLYRLLSGQFPVDGGSLAEISTKCMRGEKTPLAFYRPDVPVELRLIVDKMLALNLHERYQTADEVAHALEVLELGPVQPGFPGSSSAPSLWLNPRLAAALAVGGVVGCAGGAAVGWRYLSVDAGVRPVAVLNMPPPVATVVQPTACLEQPRAVVKKRGEKPKVKTPRTVVRRPVRKGTKMGGKGAGPKGRTLAESPPTG